MAKRTRLEIMAEILSFCVKPQRKTRVMYHVNLPWKTIQEHFSILESKGLLEVHHSQIRYATTQKGLRFVEKWSQLTELLCFDRNQRNQEP